MFFYNHTQEGQMLLKETKSYKLKVNSTVDKQKIGNRNKRSLGDLWDNIKKFNVCVNWIPSKRRKILV